MEVDLGHGEPGVGHGWGTAVDALGLLASGASDEVSVFCPRPAQDLPHLRAFIEAAIGLGVPTASVTIATPHPGSEWLKELVARSLGLAILEIRSSPGGEIVGRWTVEEALRAVCPELHPRSGDGMELSVCGAHADRMVVSTAQMSHWCMAEHRHCPHRMRRR